MQTRLFPENDWKERAELIKNSNGECMECFKPIEVKKYLYCANCRHRMKLTGFERKRVKFGEVGETTINYQQFLHIKFFGCNAHIDYRGKKENRIKNNIKPETIEKAVLKIQNIFKPKFKYNHKYYNTPKALLDVHQEIKDVRNIHKRLLYNALLYYIAYHVEKNKSFNTELHFQASMMQFFLIHIESTYIRTTKKKLPFFNRKRGNFSTKFYYALYREINNAITPLLGELYVTD